MNSESTTINRAVASSTANSVTEKLRRDRLTVSAWLIGLALLVVLLVVWGATVRLTGSGLSIPDWPLINGSLLPPFTNAGWQEVLQDYQAEAARVQKPDFPVDISPDRFRTLFLIEYTHRALAALVGIFFLAIAVKIFRTRVIRRQIEMHIIMLAALLLAQAGLGGVVVKGALAFGLVALHLGVAFIFFGGLLWTALTVLRGAETTPPGISLSAGLAPVILAWAAVLALYLQVAFGGLVAGTGAGNVFNTFPSMAGSIFPSSDLVESYRVFQNPVANLFGNKIVVQFIHRWLGFVVFALLVVLWWKTKRTPVRPRLRFLFRAGAGLLAFQLLLGIGNLITGAPVVMSALHSLTALIVFGVFVMIVFDIRYGVHE